MTKGKNWQRELRAAAPAKPLAGRARPHANAVARVESLGHGGDPARDLALMEITIPRMTGLAVTEMSRKAKPTIKVLVLSVQSNKGGEASFSEALARAALNHFLAGRGNPEPLAQLTNRERQVLKLIAEGQTNKEIAHELGIGVRTIETHRERVMRRLGIHSVAGLIKFAIVSGLVSLDEAGARD